MIREKVLIVDDHKEYADTLKIGLEKAGFEVVIKCDFATGLEAMKNGRFDIALIDVRLEVDDSPHDTSGIELARLIDSDLPIIMLTQHDTKEYAIQALEPAIDGRVPADGFVFKDSGHPAIIAKIRHILRLGNNPLMQMELENLGGLLRQHYEETMIQTKQYSKLGYWASAITGIVFVIAAVYGLTVDGDKTVSIIISISSAIMTIINFLYFARLDKANSRADKIHAELAQGYRLKLLITICESMSSKNKKVEMKEHVVKHVAQNWFANANRPVPLEDPS